MNQKIRIGVLGCASIARRSVIPAIKELYDDFELKAVASRNELKAKEFAAQFGCEAVVGYENLIARDDIDALYIPLPTGIHYEWISKAISVGKHVYAEKSFASSVVETKSLISSAAKKNTALMEGYMFLYHKQQEVVSSMILEGEIGELRNFHGCFGFPPLNSDNFRYDESLGGGVIMDAAGYPLRAAYYFCGESLVVQAATVFRDIEDTSLWGSAYLSNGLGLGASIAFGFDNTYQCRYEIWGSKGKITSERAYTAGANFSPKILFENATHSKIINIDQDNHFIGAMREFQKIIKVPSRRQDHYRQILIQSQAIEDIKTLSKLSFSMRKITK